MCRRQRARRGSSTAGVRPCDARGRRAATGTGRRLSDGRGRRGRP